MSARFSVGEPVSVANPDVRGHVRTPRYIRGKRGVVERLCGVFANPEELAYGRRDGPLVALYRVRFFANDVWGDYAGGSRDTIDVEIYEHWLTPEAT